jgi:hypothetical protein
MMFVRMLLSLTAPLAYATITGAWLTFVVPHTNDADDTPALMAAIPDYMSDASIVFEANTTYNVWSPITFSHLTNVEVVISGNLTYPKSIETVQGYVAAAVSADQSLYYMRNLIRRLSELLWCLVRATNMF